MHEQRKIDESEHFLALLHQSVNDGGRFQDNLSAFLSASRSALQYALKEACTKPGGQQWYDSQVASHSEVKYFKDKRDLNIHSEPVRTNMVVTLTPVVLHWSINAADSRKQEAAKQNSSGPENPIPTEHYFLDRLNDPIPAICNLYLSQIREIVLDGVDKGYLS